MVLSFVLIFSLCISVNAEDKKIEYELWVESPYVTSGLTYNDLNIYRAQSIGELALYPLSRLGSNYYLAICEEKISNGGYNGKTKTSYLYCYIILVNNGDFLIISQQSLGEEYYWDRGIAIQNLVSTVNNSTWYATQNSEVPYYVIEAQGKYSNYNYTEYYEQLIITSGGRIYRFSQSAEYGCEENATAYNGLLYATAYRYRSGSSYPYYMIDRSNAARLKPYIFQGGTVSYGAHMDVKTSEMTTANGYTIYKGNFGSNVSTTGTSIISQNGNTFPDGRSVSASWMGLGNYIYEIWYNIKNPDGTVKSRGPTGYSTTFSSSFDTFNLMSIAINNSKFVVCVNQVGHSFIREYYRVAVVEETISGEIISGGGSIGTKNITPPNTTDTEPVLSSIDFAQEDLPLGYNIRNNVIDSGKLDVDLRQQVNSIRLNDIVILKKAGYASGSQNTGISLTYYSNYDYSFGSNYIRFYTNGQNFLWYCYYPETLSVGTYNKTYYIGDKTIYVTIKVIAAPTNNGVTTVVF
ncbi:MAG: hypothetical protein GX800_07140, partial [Clostridiaceae bacterium]|nr:hypothetical protein [Clostridiaceae bacterium]